MTLRRSSSISSRFESLPTLVRGRLGADLERGRQFVAAELVGQEGAQVVERERRRAGPELDEGFRGFAPIGVRHADDERLLDVGMLVDRVLDHRPDRR